MNLKPVELQIALPRTTEAGIQQKQQLDRPLTEQQMLASAAVQEESISRKKAAKADETAETDIRDAEHKNGQQASQQHKQRKKKEASAQTWKHPHKGHHIDYTL